MRSENILDLRIVEADSKGASLDTTARHTAATFTVQPCTDDGAHELELGTRAPDHTPSFASGHAPARTGVEIDEDLFREGESVEHRARE